MEIATSDEAPRTPSRHNRCQLLQLSQEEVIEKVLELESELNEFQESSRELEQALEEELQELEKQIQTLRQTLETSDHELKKSKESIAILNKELVELNDTISTRTKEYEVTVSSLKKHLVSVEIANDSMEESERMLCSKLELANQFNNDLLEKIAIMENDLHREKQTNIQKNLHITNYENTIQDLKVNVTILEKRLKHSESNEVDCLFLSMKDILKDGPPPTQALSTKNGNSGMKKSDSLQRLHQLTANSESMSKKVQNLKSSMYSTQMKSTPTTKLSRHTSTSGPPQKDDPSSDKENIKANLNERFKSTKIRKDHCTSNEQALHEPKSSGVHDDPHTLSHSHQEQIMKAVERRQPKRNRRKANIFETFRSLSSGSNN